MRPELGGFLSHGHDFFAGLPQIDVVVDLVLLVQLKVVLQIIEVLDGSRFDVLWVLQHNNVLIGERFSGQKILPMLRFSVQLLNRVGRVDVS